MKKATQKKKAKPAAAPVSLGKKQECPHCGAKFYDFQKEELDCPKCNAHLSQDDFLEAQTRPAPPPAPTKALDKVDEDDAIDDDDDDDDEFAGIGEADDDDDSFDDDDDDDDESGNDDYLSEYDEDDDDDDDDSLEDDEEL